MDRGSAGRTDGDQHHGARRSVQLLGQRDLAACAAVAAARAGPLPGIDLESHQRCRAGCCGSSGHDCAAVGSEPGGGSTGRGAVSLRGIGSRCESTPAQLTPPFDPTDMSEPRTWWAVAAASAHHLPVTGSWPHRRDRVGTVRVKA